MRRTLFLLTAMALALVVGGGLALAATVAGTDRAETLYGTAYTDTIRAHGGDDEMYGLSRADRLYGGEGNDQIFGGRGDDVIYAMNGQRDIIFCGPGHDEVYHDWKDYDNRPGELRHCELLNGPPVS